MAAENLKPLTYEELKAIADQKSANMHNATHKLSQIDTELPTYQLARLYVDLRNEQQGKPAFNFDLSEIVKITRQISAMERLNKLSYVEVLYYQYMNLLPADPYEALIVDRQVTEALLE